MARKEHTILKKPAIHFHVVGLFAESIRPYLDSSILGRAQRQGNIVIDYYNPKSYVTERGVRVDRRPYGGGPGMVLEPEALLRAIYAAKGTKKHVDIIFFATDGEMITEDIARSYAPAVGSKNIHTRHIVFICGHYEGIDERVATITQARKISLGDYVLTGGELGAAIMIDAIARFVPGVLGNSNSLENMRTTDHKQEQTTTPSSPVVYTRPDTVVWKRKKYRVPEVLLSGNHAEVEKWKQFNKKSR